MAFSIGGNKDKKKSRQETTESFNQTSTTRMGDMGLGMVQDRMGQLQGQEYEGLNMGDIEQWMNPQMAAVRDATMADIGAARDKERAAYEQRQLASGPLGSSARQGVHEAEITGQYDRTMATTLAGLNANAWDKAAGIAGNEAANRNNHNMSLQQQINQLLALVAGNDTTTTSSGTSQGLSKGTQTSSGFKFGFSK